MRRYILRMGVVIAVILYSLAYTSVSFGKEWPREPITIIVGWGAGGSTDLVTRMLAEPMSKSLGVPVIVENKPGVGGVYALGLVTKAKPDGYTLGSLSCNAITERPHVKQTPYDPVNGFSYICEVFDYGHGFVVRADAPWKTFGEFIEAAKKEPGKMTVSMSSIGGTMHVALAKLEQRIPGLKLTPVPFKGGAAAVTALLGGHVDACFQTKEWKPYVDSGQLRLLAVTTKTRMKEYPKIPTWIDLGYPIHTYSPGAYVGPPNIPLDVRDRLEQEMKKAMEYPKLKEVLQKFGLIESFRPGKELYNENMRIYNENKEIIPKLGIPIQD